ncbi:hypothetical protein SODALDRAFT_82915 [Sodiomyces alkalinus F11]|uniref:EGF-like domain-containing protein n=1 Tax=Sodiomyces alkalinus (strain CBS 110278 / VKM F-3762 / F11) TaxID=1314773 RepID=A0A3N2PJI6_SODAK|nr:hypothetical protein SODALDRAFT_82915 [Sodiomyces alkalinus F11]ROT34683.1 hypothetical protein SODALDRAFT_82915 [Sodiomyces alkalinus F11]
MSRPHYGRDMDVPLAGGSVKRARERAQLARSARQPENDLTPDMSPTSSPRPAARGAATTQSRIPRPQELPKGQDKDGNGLGVPISRPTRIPQWPLPSSIPPPATTTGAEPYHPPPGRSQPPQRPPRPSQVPSILDGSRVQDPTPVFAYTPLNDRDSTQSRDLHKSVPPTTSSRQTQSTVSSVGSIPDFPIPSATTQTAPQPTLAPPQRRSIDLGPPPSSRRGLLSFYSNASFVSPIPEESPRSRSRTSFASSAAMPESWGLGSPEPSPMHRTAPHGEEPIAEEDSVYSPSQGDDDGDESRLMRSASIGKRGKPALIMNRGPAGEQGTKGTQSGPSSIRPDPTPGQGRRGPFHSGTDYTGPSSSSSDNVPAVKKHAGAAVPPTADAMLGAYVAATSAPDPVEMRKTTQSPRPFSRLSAMRRPPKLTLDMDSVRAMEARGSMTSLPDLIKRATRLAAMMDRGKRPGSRLDDLSDFAGEKALETELTRQDRHQSGLSDMLAAFPPPAGTPGPTRHSRGSWFLRTRSSWPLAPGSRDGTPLGRPRARADDVGEKGERQRRRCCGMPLWGFILLMIFVLGVVAAAVIVPIYFFVLLPGQENNRQAVPANTECQSQLTCQNGGTNVIAGGVCSCICTNGFTGSTCGVAGTAGCTTTNLVLMAEEGNINNVTLGQAIPRLIQEGQTNFSIPLVGTTILAKFSRENLSCIAQNSLVTFDGRSMRTGVADTEVLIEDTGGANTVPAGDIAGAEPVPVLTVPAPDSFRETTILSGTVTVTTTITSILPLPPPPLSTAPPTSSDDIPAVASTVSSSPPSATFTVTEEVLDFSRVAILFILQERSLDAATESQTVLQRFFAAASRGSRDGEADGGSGFTRDMARRVRLADGVLVDLVNFLINVSEENNPEDTEAQ